MTEKDFFMAGKDVFMDEKDFFMAEKDISMTKKGQTVNSFVSRTPMITLDKLTRNENY